MMFWLKALHIYIFYYVQTNKYSKVIKNSAKDFCRDLKDKIMTKKILWKRKKKREYIIVLDI